MTNGWLGEQAVLFIGRSGAGKTEAANFLIDSVPRSMLYPMAGEIKRIARSIGWDGVKDAKGRKLLQDIGSVGRAYDEDMWVNIAIETWRQDFIRGYWMDVFVSDDVRYPNEIARVREVFSTVHVIKMVRPNGHELDGEEAEHISEQLWGELPFDFEICNDDVLGKVRDCLKHIAKTIALPWAKR